MARRNPAPRNETKTPNERAPERFRGEGRRYAIDQVLSTWAETEFNDDVLRVSVETVSGDRLSLGFTSDALSQLRKAVGA